MTAYQRFKRSEWDTAKQAAEKAYKKHLGKRPSWNSVSNSIHNTHTLDPLNRLAIVLLLVVALFTAFKLATVAIPLSDNILEQNLHTSFPDWLTNVYRFSILGSAMLVGTFGLIYFKLVAESTSTRTKTEASKRFSKLRVEYWSPRLPQLLVYLSVLIIVIVSNTANQNVFDWVFNNTVVIVELALSYPVGIWMGKRQARNALIAEVLRVEREDYDSRLENMTEDKDYVSLLFQAASEQFYNIRRGKHLPNSEYRNADIREVEKILGEEYRRLEGGKGFYKYITDDVTGTGVIISAPEHKHISPENNTLSKTVAASAERRSQSSTAVPIMRIKEVSTVDKRVPPKGKQTWDTETLYADLVSINAPNPITEKWLQETYEGGYSARSVWRKHLRDQWNN